MKKNKFIKHSVDLSLPIVALDGEGFDYGELDKESNTRPHKYNLLLAADETGKSWRLDENGGINTKTSLDMILNLPEDSLIVGYSFKYDLTKIFEDLPNELIYKLNHDIAEVEWKPEGCNLIYTLAYMNGKFTVTRGNKRRVVWDFFKFFAKSFVKALEEWKIGLDFLKEIQSMKEKRGSFTPEELASVEHYCYLECVNLSRLARSLLKALDEAGLDLGDKYFGAGSVGAAVLHKMNGEDENVQTSLSIPKDMGYPIGRAFFGGRFEISKNGKLPFKIFEHDISSAYPYQIYLLPCLKSGCGEWINIKKRRELNNYQYGLVHYSLLDNPSKNYGWGPFPYRTSKHAVIYPKKSGGGYVWLKEFLAGEKLIDNVKFEDAWVWNKYNSCNHPNPFKDISALYVERCRVGKDGKGIVIKLGYNASYGKMAQCIGHPPFHNWIWAGMITSGCRAQLLELMSLHSSLHNIVMVATDGLYSSEGEIRSDKRFYFRDNISTPNPIDTGTGIDYLIDDKGNHIDKPLGGWETAELTDGLFICRPGIYFKLNDPKVKKVRSRGINAKDLISNREEVIKHFEQYNGQESFNFNITRFYGMKTSVGRHEIKANIPLIDRYIYPRRDYYGRWGKAIQEMSFSPLPKRNLDFSLRGLPDLEFKPLSEVYSKYLSDKIEGVSEYSDMLEEQPDAENTIEDILNQ